MKINIYYFSGTGNSLAVSKDIASEFDRAVNLIPVAQVLNSEKQIIDADVVGIVFPVYCHDLPAIIKEFIQKTAFNKKPYIFSVATYNKEPGNALFNLNALLLEKAIHLDAGFHISMPGNNVMVIDLTTTDEENEQRFKAKDEKIKRIVKAIKRKKQVGLEGKFNPEDAYEAKVYLDSIYKVTEQFWVTEDCKRCKTCQKVCPRNNIQCFEDKVVWGTNCEYCLACLHWCPQKAIQNGENSIKCRRYQHPDISVKEIMAQSLIEK